MNKYGLVGKNISYSLSPFIHQQLFKNFNIKNSEYQLLDIQNLGELKLADIIQYRGFNITIPYKKVIIDYLWEITQNSAYTVEISADVEILKSCNTVQIKGNKIMLSNTDLLAFNFFLEQKNIVKNIKKIAILGTGQTAQMCRYGLEQLDPSKLIAIKNISRQTQNSTLTYTQLKQFRPDLIINTTPIGQGYFRGENNVDQEVIKNSQKIIDFNYSPWKTKILQQAEDQKVENYSGLEILIVQAMESFLIWNELKISETRKKNITQMLLTNLKEKFSKNIVIYGMPLAGKSTMYEHFKKLAKFDEKGSSGIKKEQKQITFFDLDKEVEKFVGTTTKKYIEQYGIENFRLVESKIFKQLVFANENADGKLRNRNVIFTGGGTMTNRTNLSFLGTAKLIYLNPPLTTLMQRISDDERSKRPLLAGHEAYSKLYNDRHPLFLKLADSMCFNQPITMEELHEIFNN